MSRYVRLRCVLAKDLKLAEINLAKDRIGLRKHSVVNLRSQSRVRSYARLNHDCAQSVQGCAAC